MRIGEASRLSGLRASAIRYYETNGIIPLPERNGAGYREYRNGDVELLRFVRQLRSLELPLDDVREIVALRSRGDAPCASVRAAITSEAAAIDRRIEDLRRLRDELSLLQDAAADITDDWPTSCVCHILEPSSIK